IFEENEIVNREHWKLNTIVMNAVIEASREAQRIDEAYQILESVEKGLEPDSLSYNILISACIKTKKLDVTMPFNEQLKDNGQKCSSGGFHPDIFTYATLLMGFRHAKDLQSLLEIVFEMKSCCNLILDRSTFTAMVDALLYSGSIKVVGLYALCIFGEIVKRVCSNPGLWPKPHLYVSMMHELAARVDYDIVKSPYRRMWPDSTGTISPEVQEEAGHLLMEAALNDGQVDLALDKLSNTITRWKGI
ncbi:hypothetical protein CISIN_1g043380mg, partial [Citrus sinensis]